MSHFKEKQIWKEPAFVVGIVLTFLVLGGFAYTLFAWPMNDVHATKWAYLRHAQPNEIGDTLAGVAGTLAFVWIVVTVWLQATELREQRQEFRRMASAQEEQVAVLEKQGQIFELEMQQRLASIAEEDFNAQLRSLLRDLDGLTVSAFMLSGPNCYRYDPKASIDANAEQLWVVVGDGLFPRELNFRYEGIDWGKLKDRFQAIYPKLSDAQKARWEFLRVNGLINLGHRKRSLGF